MPSHIPVLLEEVLKYAEPKPNQNFVDATFGGGGHARAILNRLQPSGRLFVIDVYSEAIREARKLGRGVIPIQENFCNIEEAINEAAPGVPINGILFDLGISSDELSDQTLGLSFQTAGPLDMRLSEEGSMTAALIINSWSESELTRILKEFGEEREASRIARAIQRRRGIRLFTETTDLAEVIKEAVNPKRRRESGIHPATKTFQALRIAVNNELENLRLGLGGAMKLLASGGRLVVISFHSLEDRIVKEMFREAARTCVCPPLQPRCTCEHKPLGRILTKKPVTPNKEEIEKNPRARSAKLRAFEKI